MNVYVFLGPSLPAARAREVLDAHYLSPVTCGDVTDLVLDRDPPAAIGIVDGYFEQVPTVWHKEILFAISRGVRVYGASSMGALRAAELSAFGMQGVGRVFEGFASGEYTDDDEVAIVHAGAEDCYRPLSEAMVNLRAGLADAAAAGVIGPTTHDRLVAVAKDTHYPDRSWPRLLADGRDLGLPADELDGLREHVRRVRPDVKRADALALVERVRDDLAAGLPPVELTFDLEPTFYWEKLLAVVREERAARRVGEVLGGSADMLLRYLAEHLPHVLDTALGRVLARREASRLGLVDADDNPLESDEAIHRVLVRRLSGALVGPALSLLEAEGRVDSVRAALATYDPAGAPAEAGTAPLPAGRRE
ncbi:TfuA-like protein [Saccharothrix sp. NPDC042600]|uniref:TfuA-like protein n=1 Tax=Saccharothrix TaxID=2071 RepID=UPI0033EB9D5C|nr:hypothetical protein GCM10017745_48030 [Saccharothrix mutabilis subsp. capreolus]